MGLKALPLHVIRKVVRLLSRAQFGSGIQRAL